jgi:glycyl-tRNA synthetase beta chain
VKLLFELGTEELPALEAPRLAQALAERVLTALEEARLPHGEAKVHWTPRRLALLVEGLPEKQEDRVEELRGPAASVGLDEQGHPTQAGIGFAKKHGASPDQLVKKKVGEREYLFLTVRTPGRPTGEVLQEILPEAVRGLPCSKSMRWDDSGLSFLRPIRWLVCLLESEVVPVKLGHLVAGRTTRGHRFFGPREVELSNPDDYLEALRGARVLADPEERGERIRAEVRRVEEEHRVRASLSEELLGRLVGAGEWPVGVLGTIPREFLDLPPEVIEATLHEEGKFVPFSRDGAPAEVFLGFRDGAPDETGVVRRGYERVVKARLRDSRFFFENDRKRPLADRVRGLKEVVYEARLGSMWQRVERIRAICGHLAEALELPAELLDRAAFLCKADLTTDMVREFPELEGVMGGIYARLDGEPEEVAIAIGEHLRPRSRSDELPETPLGTALSLAEKLDAVIGAIRIGEVPTGSRDPYGIRRRGGAIVRLILEKRLRLDLYALIDATSDLYPQVEGGLGSREVKELLQDRLRATLRADHSLPHDVVEAVLAAPRGDFLGALERAQALAALRGDPALSELAVAFSRVRNITKDHDRAEFDPDLFKEEAERELWRAYLKAEGHLRRALRQRQYAEALRHLLTLKEPVDRYFDDVLVMAEDRKLRENRLGFLRAVTELFLEVGDLSRLVVT